MSHVGGRVVKHTLHIDAQPETVWRFFTDPERLCQWWGWAEVDARPGGTFRVSMREGPCPIMRGEFVELVPFRRISFTFGWEVTQGGARPTSRLLARRGNAHRTRRRYPAHSPAQRTATDAGGRNDRWLGASPEPPRRSRARPAIAHHALGHMIDRASIDVAACWPAPAVIGAGW